MEEQGFQSAAVSEHPHRVLRVVIVLVVLVALLVLGLWLKNLEDSRGVTTEIKPGQEITRVEQGRVVRNFPEEFLPSAGTVIEESYSISYLTEGVEQPVVRYTSTESLGENVAAFAELLERNGWEVTQEADAGASGVTFFYAIRGLEEVNITLVPATEGTTVIISYVLKSAPLDGEGAAAADAEPDAAETQ